MTRYNKFIVMAVTAVGAVAVVAGIIGTAKRWWRDGIDPQFVLLLVLGYCAWVFIEHVWGKQK